MFSFHSVPLKSLKNIVKLSSFQRSFMDQTKHFCVIGAGTAGLCSAKHILANGGTVTVYEHTKDVGGTWVYSNQVGHDQYGHEICSSMYQGLMTNLPKEIMGFPDYAIKHENSYVDSETIQQFLKSYYEDFNLKSVIKFEHYVLKVKPINNGNKWEVIVKNLPKNEEIVELFDFIFVCNGHYSTPNFPNYPGRDIFKGKQTHSHNYRRPEPYKNESVLVIGVGSSGKDISTQIAPLTKKICVSHHSEKNLDHVFPENVIQKPDVARLLENGVEFVDGSVEDLSVIIFCTGYLYNFPFLAPECGVVVKENCVHSLYKHIININNPKMAFIGIPFICTPFQMVDLQVRFALKFYLQGKALPSKEEMFKDTTDDLDRKWKLGYKTKQAHLLGPDQEYYFDDLAETADIEPLKSYIISLYNQNQSRTREDFKNFRKDNYKIVDEENFVKIN